MIRSRLLKRRLLVGTVLAVALSALTVGSSTAGPSTRDSDTARLLAGTSRSTTWIHTSALPLKFDTYHPHFMTSVEVIEAPVTCKPAC